MEKVKQTQKSGEKSADLWWQRSDLNPRPKAYEGQSRVCFIDVTFLDIEPLLLLFKIRYDIGESGEGQ